MRHDEVLICISKANFIRYLLKSLPQVFQFYLTIDSDKWNRVFPQPSHKPIIIKGNLILSLSFYYFLKDRDYVRVDWYVMLKPNLILMSLYSQNRWGMP